MNSVELLHSCAEIQKKLFYRNYFASGKAGEITCVNGVDNEDTIMFERFPGFIVTYRLWCEDSCDSIGRKYPEKPVADFVAEKALEQSARYTDFLRTLVLAKKTLEQMKAELMAAGEDPSQLDNKEFTRFHLEEMLQPGRKRINGDRNSRIQIMHRHTDIPNDLQKPAVSVFTLPLPAEVEHFLTFTDLEEQTEWARQHLTPASREYELGCYLPMLTRVVDVFPTIYRFPEKEVDVENA